MAATVVAALLALAAPARAQDATTIGGEPLSVSADGVGGLQIRLHGTPVLDGPSGFALKPQRERASLPGDPAREPVSGPTIGGDPAGTQWLLSTYAVGDILVDEEIVYANGSDTVGASYSLRLRDGGAASTVRVGVLGHVAGPASGAFVPGSSRWIGARSPDGSLVSLLLDGSYAWSSYEQGPAKDVLAHFGGDGLNGDYTSAAVDGAIGAEGIDEDVTSSQPTGSPDQISWRVSGPTSQATVDTGDDGLSGTLRAALAAAAPGGVVTLPAGHYTLDEPLAVDRDVTIAGADPRTTVIDGLGRGRALDVTAGTLTLSGVTVTGGNASGPGGGVRVASGAALSFLDGTISGNAAETLGGGIYADGAVALLRSAVVRNTAGEEGGGLATRGGTTLINTTISGNSASSQAGGLSVFGPLLLVNDTIAANDAPRAPGLLQVNRTLPRGRLAAAPFPAAVEVDNTIVDQGCSVESFGYYAYSSMSPSESCGMGSPADPELAPLVLGDAPTETHALDPHSAALGAADAARCPTTDQRGAPRPEGGGCDAGAYQLARAAVTAPEIRTPEEDATITTGSFQVAGQAPAGATVTLYDGDRQLGEDTRAFGAGTWNTEVSSPADGTHVLTATATVGGQTSERSAPRTITIAQGGGGPPETYIDRAPEGPTNDGSPTFEFSSTEPGATFECRLEGRDADFSLCDSPKTYGALADGSYTFDVFAVGDDTPATRSFTIDTVAPAKPQILDSFGSIVLRGTADEGTTVEVFEGDESIGRTEANVDGAWQLSRDARDGEHTYTALSTDAARNVSERSAPWTATVDTVAPATPAIAFPAADDTASGPNVRMRGTAEPGVSILVEDGPTPVSGLSVRADRSGAWRLAFIATVAGKHQYNVEALDDAGNHSGPAQRTIVVDPADTAAPETAIASGPGGVTAEASPAFSFSADAPDATFECRLQGVEADFADCDSPKAYRDLPQGDYTLLVRATNAVGNTDASPASRSFTVDTTPPAAPTVGGPDPSGSSVTLSGTADPRSAVMIFEGATQVASTTAGPDGAWTLALDGVSPGQHVYTAVAQDTAGNRSGSSPARTVLVGSAAQATPSPTPSPTPTPTPLPPPVVGQSVNVTVESGTVLVKVPGSNRFVPLTADGHLPVGTIVDATDGKVRLTAASDGKGATESAFFYGGIFKIGQSKGAKPVTELVLAGPKPSCKARAAAGKKPKSRKLWGDGSGSFRTRGQYSAATVRGTNWLTEDRCDGTFTRVVRGVVSVQDFVRHKTIVLRAGKHYLARPKK